jgi:hypothetical protein
MICPTAKAEYFLRWDWTGQIRLKCFSKFVCARTPEGGHLRQSDGGLAFGSIRLEQRYAGLKQNMNIPDLASLIRASVTGLG